MKPKRVCCREREGIAHPFKVGSIAVPDIATTVVKSFDFNASIPALKAAGYVAEAEPERCFSACSRAFSTLATVYMRLQLLDAMLDRQPSLQSL